jgi:hypothetical protein
MLYEAVVVFRLSRSVKEFYEPVEEFKKKGKYFGVRRSFMETSGVFTRLQVFL